MAISPNLPRTLPAWLKTLDDVRLPAPADELSQARQALADDRLSLRDMAEQIQAAPVAVLELMREANRSNHALGDPAETLEVALTRIGLKRAGEIVARIPKVPPEQPLPPFYQLVLISQHASQQASGLFAVRLARLWQEIHWSSLLFLSPVWTLAAAYPQLLEQWEERVLLANEPVKKVEQNLLGMPLVELCLAVARRWRLPDWIIEGYRLLCEDRRKLVKALHIVRDNEHPLAQQQVLDANTELRRWMTLPSNTPVLANGLAIAAYHSWSGLHTLRWECLASLYLHQPLPTLQQLIHQQAVRSARSHARAGFWHPASSLIWPWQSRYPLPKPPKQAAPIPAAPKPQTASSDALQLWRKHCAELLKSPSPFVNLLQLLTTVRDALLACGARRMLLLQLDPARNLLVTRKAVGLPDQAQQLLLDPTHSQLLRHLMEKPKQLHLNHENFARFTALLPGALKSVFASEHLLLRSIGSNGRTVMLLIVDQSGAPIAENTLQAFAKTAQCLERALDLYAKRQR